MSVQRTIYGQVLQACQYLDIPFNLNKVNTLNTKLDVYGELDLPPNTLPKLRYIAIGNGGHSVVSKPGGVVTFRRLPHRVKDAALYNQLPFIVREMNNDLITSERAKYALRKIIEVDGVNYIAYYLKRLDLSDTSAVIKHAITENGTTNVSEFTPSNADLNPTPPEYIADGTNVTRAEELYTEALINVVFTKADRDEFMDVIRLLYNDEDVSIISELALCSGVDRQVTVNTPSGDLNYNEAIGVQVNHHIQVFRSMKEDNNGFTVKVNVGASDPMYVED